MNRFTKFTIKRRTSSKTWDVRNLVKQAKLIQDMNYSAGELDFTLYEVDDDFGIKNGDVVTVDWNGHHVFKGYVFSWEFEESVDYKVVAYDSLRYFKSTDSHLFPVSTLGQRFNTICDELKVKHRIISAPSHKLKSELCDDITYFAMLQKFIHKQRIATGDHYFLRDNFGTIELRKYPHKKLPYFIGDKSLVTNYSFKRSIESSANVIRLVKSRNDKGHKSISTVSDSGNTIKRWGKLVYTKQVTSKSNPAQMHKQAHDLLKKKNKQINDLRITCIGHLDLEPGNEVTVKIKELRDIYVGTKKYLITKATHTFDGGYTTELELRV